MSRPKRLVLASASPRRRQLLADAGYIFDVVPSDVDESASPDTDPDDTARALALAKARDVAGRVGVPAVVLGADTLVACTGQIIGKPADADDARRILHTLSRTPHQVITGVALVDTADGHERVESDTSRVIMKPMSPADIDVYIASGAWQGKAGAYAVQEEGIDRFILRIDGSFSNVVGLPLELVQTLLKEFNIHSVRM